jgi:hypothetical protein
VDARDEVRHEERAGIAKTMQHAGALQNDPLSPGDNVSPRTGPSRRDDITAFSYL